MNTIHLIDNDHKKGWEAVFRMILDKVYSKAINFNCLQFTDSKSFYEDAEKLIINNPNDIFILDNDLGNDYSGLNLLVKYGKTHKIIFHTANIELGFKAGCAGAIMFMEKDNPANPKSEFEFSKMVRNFHLTIINTFELAPEFIWIVDEILTH